VFSLTTPIQYRVGHSSNVVREEEEIKSIPIVREEIKLFLFSDDMIIYVENSKGLVKKPLWRIQN
jgi:hypothetical protein